jgi:hypothetical protein
MCSHGSRECCVVSAAPHSAAMLLTAPGRACFGPVRSLADAASHECKAFMLQADLARARSASAATAEDASALRIEADSLRKALRAMEARLAEYQAKDTEV